MHAPLRPADLMAFGILTGSDTLSVPAFKIGTFEQVLVTTDILDSTRKASQKLRDIHNLLVDKWDAQATYGFSDIISLAMPVIRLRGSTMTRIPIPTPHYSSIMNTREGFVIFSDRLNGYITDQATSSGLSTTSSHHTTWVLKQYQTLKARYPEWETGNSVDSRATCHPSLAFLEEVHTCHNETTDYFLQLQKLNHLRYFDLLASHVSHAVNYWGDAWHNIRNKQTRPRPRHNGTPLRALEAEGMHLYFDYLPKIVADMRQRGYEGEDNLVYEAWFMMMFRAFCWNRCHFSGKGQEQVY